MLKLVCDVAAAGKIADEDALPIADKLGSDVFVRGGILHNGADVHAALMREGALADVRLVFPHRQVGQIGNVAACGSQRLELIRADRCKAEFELECEFISTQLVPHIDAIETVVDTYLKFRTSPAEDFLAAYRRIGMGPFKEALYGHE